MGKNCEEKTHRKRNANGTKLRRSSLPFKKKNINKKYTELFPSYWTGRNPKE